MQTHNAVARAGIEPNAFLQRGRSANHFPKNYIREYITDLFALK